MNTSLSIAPTSSERRCANWLDTYVQHHAPYSEAPEKFHFWAGVFGIAGALRRRVWVDMKQFHWTPNFYLLYVGPPAIVKKSTTVGNSIRILRKVPGVHIGPQSTTWQALLEAFIEAQEPVQIANEPETRLMCCLTIAAREFGTFFRPDNTEMHDTLTDMYDGLDEYNRRTVQHKETVIHCPWINIAGCATPVWIRDNFPPGMVGGGLTSRFLFIYGDKRAREIAYPDELPDPPQAEQEALVHDLIQISQLTGKFHLTAEARDMGRIWYHYHVKEGDSQTVEAATDTYLGYWGRKQTHIHKLAMILSVAEGNDLCITKNHLEKALAHVTGLEEDMKRVFKNIGVTASSKRTTDLRDLIDSLPRPATYHEIWSMCIMTFDGNQKLFTDCLTGLVSAGLVIRVKNAEGVIGYTKPR